MWNPEGAPAPNGFVLRLDAVTVGASTAAVRPLTVGTAGRVTTRATRSSVHLGTTDTARTAHAGGSAGGTAGSLAHPTAIVGLARTTELRFTAITTADAEQGGVHLTIGPFNRASAIHPSFTCHSCIVLKIKNSYSNNPHKVYCRFVPRISPITK